MKPVVLGLLAQSVMLSPQPDQMDLDQVPLAPRTVVLVVIAVMIALVSIGFMIHLVLKIRRTL